MTQERAASGNKNKNEKSKNNDSQMKFFILHFLSLRSLSFDLKLKKQKRGGHEVVLVLCVFKGVEQDSTPFSLRFLESCWS